MARFVNGVLVDPSVTYRRCPLIERGPLNSVRAIVMHQTHTRSALQTIDVWQTRPHGAHFLVDRGDEGYRGIDGKIYQTARVTQRCTHVGRMRERCQVTQTCTVQVRGQRGRRPAAASYPARFPTSSESIGIEIVGFGEGPEGQEVYADPTEAQVRACVWLVEQIVAWAPSVGLADIYSHGEGWYKRPTEGVGFWDIVIESQIPILGRIVRSRSLREVDSISVQDWRERRQR